MIALATLHVSVKETTKGLASPAMAHTIILPPPRDATLSVRQSPKHCPHLLHTLTLQPKCRRQNLNLDSSLNIRFFHMFRKIRSLSASGGYQKLKQASKQASIATAKKTPAFSWMQPTNSNACCLQIWHNLNR